MELQDKKIFVVEDNPGNRAITGMLLEQQGAQVKFDRGARDVIELLKNFMPIDLIILDLMLPKGITGFDVFDEIRKHPEFEDVPIIAVSAADASIVIPEAQEKGFSGFISKPIDFQLFPKQIASVISGEEIWSSSTQL